MEKPAPRSRQQPTNRPAAHVYKRMVRMLDHGRSLRALARIAGAQIAAGTIAPLITANSHVINRLANRAGLNDAALAIFADDPRRRFTDHPLAAVRFRG